MRTDSRSTSIRSPLATRPHPSNLYGRIERFVRFLRGGDVQAGGSPTVAQLIARGWLRVVDCARGSWRRAGSALGIARVVCVLIYTPNFGPIGPGPTGPANVAPGLRHRHNGPGSPGPLIGPLEGHPELPMILLFSTCFFSRLFFVYAYFVTIRIRNYFIAREFRNRTSKLSLLAINKTYCIIYIYYLFALCKLSKIIILIKIN